MKVAYISVYRDGTGYGNAALSMIKSISMTGATVVPIWITLSKIPNKEDSFVKSLESNDLNGIDVVIQQCLPDMFVRIEGVKNIGYFFWETDSFVGSGWKNGCDLMDEIWVTTNEQKEACVKSGIKENKIKVIDQPKELFKCNSFFDFTPYGIENTFKFYTISDYSNKKNVNAVIHSFLTEFSVYDNVSLVVKTYISGKTAEESKNHVKGVVAELKRQIGKPDKIYPKIAIICNMMTEEGLSSLENACDCFVSASRGEGEGLPMVQAALRGKPVIAPNISGISKNFKNKTLLIKAESMKKVIGMNSGNYYNYNENWNDPSTSDLCEKMRSVLESRINVQNIVLENKEFIEANYSLESCSKKIKEIL